MRDPAMLRCTSAQVWSRAVIENSSAGLVMLGNEVAVAVTGEEHHQSVLTRYPVAPGEQRFVAVELGWCTIRSGKYRGQQAVEVRLDGRRVGELTHLMSQRYGAMVGQILTHGGRPGCAAVIQRGERKLELVLRLPHVQAHAAVPAPRTGGSKFAPNSPVWIGAGVIAAVLLIGGLASGLGDDNASPATTSGSQLTTSTSAEPTTTTVAPTTTQPTTTAPAAVIPPAPAVPPVTTTKAPAPKTTTKTQAPPPPPPPTQQPPPPPASKCDPNYTGCVPVASDVDCAGGSGNGPAYVQGPVRVIGSDIYDLDRDHDGIACE
jgi:hypothetical protein